MSQIKEEFARSLYKSIGFLNQDKDIQLVQHQIDGKIYVMKSQKQSYREIYHLLLKHSHKNIVRFMEVLNGEENLLIIEEYVTGDTIDEFLGKKEKISDKTIRS
ncbi:MAG TPA: hypothetical protein DHN33_06115, partial [Eubacteriaceae bacterium]|nr:hypothetical protein [Eubacteriaceae bacterium]